MDIPGFAAERSLYQTKNHYWLAADGGSRISGNETVTPQGCGFVEGLVCGALIPIATTFCVGTCVESGGLACAACFSVALGAAYSACKDCLPAWIRAIIDSGSGDGGGGGGGGGGTTTTHGPCGCPLRTRCCGKCVKMPGRAPFCDDECVATHLQCP
jgi:hypothetical protein